MPLKSKLQYIISSDWHFGHRKMETLCNRPPDFEYLIMSHLYTKCVNLIKDGHEIILLNLGDVCWNTPYAKELTRETLTILSKWCKSIHLVKGNHDRMTNKQYLDMGFSSVQKELFVSIPCGWEEEYSIHLTHRPMDRDNLEKLFSENIHGHLHQNLPERVDRQFLISQELLDYRPITLEEILEIGQTPKWDGEKFVTAYEKT